MEDDDYVSWTFKREAEHREMNQAQARRHNNPHNEPTGHYTGRCRCCGSNDLWDDNLAYGCNSCGALLLAQNS